ncbi:class I SAM-dependent methyltransferase [Desulfatitalea alkaliphila]|uniref:Class I SAM-dependent methyltransferase n=1 Tax=Desulfatitalea alkaliphila TaxID=2929485 RepID=A0AA41UR02_9BACT|nr:class I SAM-dependent methyltransferase [Desulfatitalea alkaliphila]MCJ8501868.1 class I SAM-dependent methyltransferase [Desulfatitalea alkaliphila]
MVMREGLNGWLLYRMEGVMDRIYGARKRAVYGGLPGTVVEIGAGAGANFRYYAPGTRVIAIEPNRAMHPYLWAAARRRGIDLEIRSIPGEASDLPDNSVAAVVGTLVLCTVADPQQVVARIQRMLAPGGRYIFLEHVAALPGTPLRGLQEWMQRGWRWCFDGCHLNRDTQHIIQAAGFARVDMDCFVMRSRWMPFAPHIFGVAEK